MTRSNAGAILTAAAVVVILVVLGMARYALLDRPPESESNPNRSTYNSGPTGVKGLYQTLEQSGRPVGRWRESFRKLERNNGSFTLVMIGPFDPSTLRDPREIGALERWVSDGGQLLLITRSSQFRLAGGPFGLESPGGSDSSPELDPNSDRFILQPTRITRGLRGLALTHLATRLLVEPVEFAQASSEITGKAKFNSANEIDSKVGPLSAPVVHLGDENGAILLDFNYGGGRVIMLTEPFVVANNGINQGANLVLARNLIKEIQEPIEGSLPLLLFDEYHHGYRNDSNPLVGLLRGTVWPLILVQLSILVLVLCHRLSHRFTRPIPLPEPDRRSPLDFVDSMARLQQAAGAHDLAIENIYPRFRARLCRHLGLPRQATAEAIGQRLALLNSPTSSDQIRQTLVECELILSGETVSDQQLIQLIATIRSFESLLPAASLKGRHP